MECSHNDFFSLSFILNINKSLEEMNMLKFKGQSSVFLIAIFMIVAILMALSLMATANAATTSNVATKFDVNNGETTLQKTINLQGEVSKKFKKVKAYTLTFNANSGKVSKKSVKLPSKKKLGTLPKAIRSGYTFQGWYTAKKGGKKVSKESKMPAKNTVIYAQWKKKNNSGTANKIVGSWTQSWRDVNLGYFNAYYYKFDANGNFDYTNIGAELHVKGKYSTSNGNIYLTKLICDDLRGKKTSLKNQQYKYSIGNDGEGNFY